MMGKYVDETCYKCGRSLQTTSNHSTSVFRRSNNSPSRRTAHAPTMKTLLVVVICVLLLAGQSLACGKGIELGPKAQCEKRRECEMARVCRDFQGHEECAWKPVCKVRLSCKGAPRPPIPFSNK
ncbi:uncharacterized protein [Branchiostoma lanceolatum]|uniref:uncharacterized protein n=1 Tax=Branchiostoma lanceolatum TaxID=7740 RepID=UPI003456E6ED